MSFRALTAADLTEVLAAEATLHESPWTPGNFRDSITTGHQLFVAEEDGTLVGYAVTSRVLDEAELLTLGIVKAAQRQGRGLALLDHVIGAARAAGAIKLFLEVRSGNVPAHQLYMRRGFVEIARRRGYYPAKTGREDAIVMALDMAVPS